MNILKAFWRRLTSPSKVAVGLVLFMGFMGGLLFWGRIQYRYGSDKYRRVLFGLSRADCKRNS